MRKNNTSTVIIMIIINNNLIFANLWLPRFLLNEKQKKNIHIAFSRIILRRTSKLCASVCNVTISPLDDLRTFKKPYSSIPTMITFSCQISTKTSLFL